jgi:hypothetical protein
LLAKKNANEGTWSLGHDEPMIYQTSAQAAFAALNQR